MLAWLGELRSVLHWVSEMISSLWSYSVVESIMCSSSFTITATVSPLMSTCNNPTSHGLRSRPRRSKEPKQRCFTSMHNMGPRAYASTTLAMSPYYAIYLYNCRHVTPFGTKFDYFDTQRHGVRGHRAWTSPVLLSRPCGTCLCSYIALQ